MPILNQVDRKSPRGRAILLAMYLILSLGGVAMVYPFLITITGSFGTPLDYYRRDPVPHFLWNRPDRFMRTLTQYFPPSIRTPLDEMRGHFPDLPPTWRTWRQIGDEREESRRWAERQLRDLHDPGRRQSFAVMAADLSEFLQTWPAEETVLAYNQRDVSTFLRSRYDTVAGLNAAWHLAIESFNEVRADEWRAPPLDQSGYLPVSDARFSDLLAFREAYRENRFTPFLRHRPGAAGFLRPAALAQTWERFALAQLDPEFIREHTPLPFPVPETAPEILKDSWLQYLVEQFPLRHIEIEVTPLRQAAYQEFLEARFGEIRLLVQVLRDDPGFEGVSWTHWHEIPLPAQVPDNVVPGRIWMDFVRNSVPVSEWTVRETLSELAFQSFALERHGSLEHINAAYGLSLSSPEQLRLPFRGAFLHTFNELEWRFVSSQTFGNYYTALDFLVLRGNAVPNTLILIALTMMLTLTVNPLAAYAMSRFRLRRTNEILLYFVGTMAFPASISAIPGFLLLRDLGLLNTFAALVLPSAANGMAIFLLKGFFDSLPQELYEAATIDGASEMQIFRIISLPLVKPILAVNALNAFILAYNGWEWAIIVAQDRRMWTLAVWTYQFSQTFASEPFVVMAAFLLNSFPVFLVFCLCQKIIMRGVVLPQMK
jgi:multiple sugar transport system permease protein